MKQHKFNAVQFEANMAALPETCFAEHIMDGTLIIIKRGEQGYVPAADKWPPLRGESIDQQVRRMNERMGVTTAQRMAMVMGSLSRFDTPGADPESHKDRALVEDLMSVDKTLGREAQEMLRLGADYDTIFGRFKAIFDAASAEREPA
jgi:hypothetical protein